MLDFTFSYIDKNRSQSYTPRDMSNREEEIRYYSQEEQNLSPEQLHDLYEHIFTQGGSIIQRNGLAMITVQKPGFPQRTPIQRRIFDAEDAGFH